MTNDAWWKEVEAVIESKSLLKHPFYRAWQAGELTLENLRDYARQYYAHVAAFPRYVSAAHSGCEDLGTRQVLLENLIEEERGDDNHPELWLRFAEGVGASRESVKAAQPRAQTRDCVETFVDVTRNGSTHEALAALYAYESQIPAVSETKIQGLASFYGIKDERSQKFFSVHKDADVWHSQVEREAIVKLARTEEQKAEVIDAVRRSCDAVWKLLDGVCEAQKICTTC